jgi:hypothetical protein
MSDELLCDHCGETATRYGWAFPSGGSFPVTGCDDCLDDLTKYMAVDTRPIPAL